MQASLPPPITPSIPISALAPMQDVTTLPFIHVLHQLGSLPDYFFTEYFRVHAVSTPEPHIIASIAQNPTNRPVFAQLIGEDPIHIRRTILHLHQYPIAGIDLNMGCPAPRIYKKNVGGGLLRDPSKIELLFDTIRQTQSNKLFTVKMRIGFEDSRHFDTILSLINKYKIDLLSLHGRTVKEMYRSEVHYDAIKHAALSVHCPLLANGNITSPQKAKDVLLATKAHGVMIGRSAIRNPWIFLQTRQFLQNLPLFQPTLQDVYHYISLLDHHFTNPSTPENVHVSYLKKFLNFIGLAVDPHGQFLYHIRRVQSRQDLHNTCQQFLLNHHASTPFPLEPHPGLIARPNCESPTNSCSL